MLIGIRQGALVRRGSDAQVFHLAFNRPQPIADLPQRLGLPQLAKQHRHKLSPTIKSARVALGLMLPHGFLELDAGEEVEQLGENAAYSIQGGSLRRLNLVLDGPKSKLPTYRPEILKLFGTGVIVYRRNGPQFNRNVTVMGAMTST